MWATTVPFEGGSGGVVRALSATLLLCSVRGAWGQQQNADVASCYGSGSIATAVILTLILTLLLQYVGYVIWKRYWKYRTEHHLVLQTDPEKGRKEDYAFDNDGFKDPTINSTSTSTAKSKWNQWSPLGALIHKNEKQRTVDDSVLQGDEIKTVSLKSHDFTGLGFNIYGNMRDGIFIRDILHRGPASQSGKLNPGDRIQSVAVNFEHIVYEDALTILSYASPYEVILEAKGGKLGHNSQTPTTKTVHLGHPLYRSSSTTDLMQITKSSKKRLFPTTTTTTTDSKTCSPYSSLQKAPETSRSKSPEWGETTSAVGGGGGGGLDATKKSPQQLKTQLEQKISQNHKQQLRAARDMKPPERRESETQRTENKYQRFGIKVLPVDSKDQISPPKGPELSQNENNANLERHRVAADEVDRVEVKRRERETGEDETFVRQGSVNGSGIRRDKDGIPQEIPNHMLNAAVAARRNRKGSADNVAEEVKSPKKPKGRAPAPPPTAAAAEDDLKVNSSEGKSEVEARKPEMGYASDSDPETDNLSSVNTIELNSNDITIHQTEETEEVPQNRRTASTGDLTKMIQRTRKTSSGTLERAQSLDITDTGMPTLSKKRKGGSIEENLGGSNSGSNESLYGKALIHKEPRLSLALDGLNTFQRSRLKKSTEWGNLEDAVLNLNKDEERLEETKPNDSEFDALVNKINEIKRESLSLEEEVFGHKFEFNNTRDTGFENCNGTNDHNEDDDVKISTNSFVWQPITKAVEPPKAEMMSWSSVMEDLLTGERRAADDDPYYSFRSKVFDVNAPDDLKASRHLDPKPEEVKPIHIMSSINVTSEPSFIKSEPIEHKFESIGHNLTKYEPIENETLTESEMYVTASDATLLKGTDSPDLIKNLTLTTEPFNETVTIEGPTSLTIEGPTSLTFEIPSSNEVSNKTVNISTPKSNYSRTYITEIQVMTPTPQPQPKANDDQEEMSLKLNASPSSFEQHKSRFEVKTDPEQELHKIQEIAEEQLKKLPEMRFTTSSYESPKSPTTETTGSSHIEHLRSNFERSPPSPSKPQPKIDIGKSRIPVATTKTPPTSPERRDSRNFDMEVDGDIVAMMSAPIVHSTPIAPKLYPTKVVGGNKNVSVTSIRSNSRIPSGLAGSNRPPVPPRKYESGDGEGLQHRGIATNGNVNEGPFKQWLFSPNNNVVTNLTVVDNKSEQK